MDVPEEAQADLHFYFVENMQQVIDRVLLAPPRGGRKRDLERAEEEKSAEKVETANEP